MGSGRADPKMFEMMKNAGVDVKAYGEKYKVWDLNDRWHEKHLIVDGKASVEGGMNVANEYALGGSGKQVFSRGDGKVGTEAWRDADIKLEGPAVGDAMKAFVRNWDEMGGKLSDADRQKLFPKLSEVSGGGTSVRVVQSNPEVKGLVGTTDKLYLRAIENAQKSITIENAYFLPPPEIRKALIDAAKRGVEIKVMTNSKESNDMGFVADAARYFYDDMIKAGVQINEKHGGTLHAKTATFDGEFSVVGSVNLNGRSKNQDAEVALAVQDGATAKQLEQRYAAGLKETTPVKLQDLQKESFVTNLKQWALSTLAWTF
jgi:cardiolipin synthase